ncbi:MAG: hypothetical protein K8S94_01775 [Planctomycetia bacterium]|nr:hypothetical protein [Planctomycetia bacterium]
MSDQHEPKPLGHQLALLAQRLERLPREAPSPKLRRRVLASIDDVLAEKAPSVRDAQDRRIPGWTWAAAALLGCALVTNCVAAALPILHAEPLTLAQRLRAVSAADDSLLASLVSPPSSDSRSILPRREAAPAVRLPARVIDIRRLSKELL